MCLMASHRVDVTADSFTSNIIKGVAPLTRGVKKKKKTPGKNITKDLWKNVLAMSCLKCPHSRGCPVHHQDLTASSVKNAASWFKKEKKTAEQLFLFSCAFHQMKRSQVWSCSVAERKIPLDSVSLFLSWMARQMEKCHIIKLFFWYLNKCER